MYLMPIPVPVFVDGDRQLVATDWKRALRLLRDSLEERYGDIVVAAPWLPADDPTAREQTLETMPADERIRFEAVIPLRTRTRAFWLREAVRYRARMAALVAQSRVVHSCVNDPFRPIVEVPLVQALRRGLPTVLVQDTDSILQLNGLGGSLQRRAFVGVFTRVLERSCRAAVSRVDLALLKGKALMGRYGQFARNAHEFHDTSYLSTEMASAADVEARLASMLAQGGTTRPLRLVYCGRLVARKGVARSIDLVARARKLGADLTFEVIGNGPEEAALREQITAAEAGSFVRLAGAVPYGPDLLRRLATFDALLFTPPAEDTPRMIFDGYAAGLPLVGDPIPYVRERAEEEHAALLLPADAGEAAARLAALATDRRPLVPLTHAALHAGHYHAADAWYRRRAEWTHEAIARH